MEVRNCLLKWMVGIVLTLVAFLSDPLDTVLKSMKKGIFLYIPDVK
jgi:hypothetical protein